MDKKSEFLIYLIDSMQDYVAYKELCEKKEKDLSRYTYEVHEFQEVYKHSHVAAEEGPIYSASKPSRKKLSIPFDSIIEYMKDLESVEDVKTIQLMLFELIGDECSKTEYKKIKDAQKNMKRRYTVNVEAGGNYIHQLGKQNNRYGR